MLHDQTATKEVLSFKKNPGNLRIEVSKVSQPDLVEQFVEAFAREYEPSQPGDSATEKCGSLCGTKCIAPHRPGHDLEVSRLV